MRLPPNVPTLALPGLACAAPTARYPGGRTGTRAGDHAHRYVGEPVCEPCRRANNEVEATKRARKAQRPQIANRTDVAAVLVADGMACARPTAKYPTGRTGTIAGNNAHRTAKEPQCPECREAGRLKAEAFNQSAEGKAYRHGYYVANKRHHAARNLKRKSGMTEHDYRKLLAAQGGKCAICGDTNPGGRWKHRGRFHVDHDHACCPGKSSCGRCVRGLLCGACNVGLGAFRDNQDALMTAVAYLLTGNSEVRHVATVV